MIRIRPLETFDIPSLPHFLALAAHEDDVQTALGNPNLARYIEGFGRRGDCGVVAQEQTNGVLVGMAWARFWTAQNCGFGWIDENTPELAIAVEPNWQNQGSGAQLIESLKSRLREVSPATRVALNVRAASPAVRLYTRLGFEKISGSERRNRTGGQSFNMSATL